MGGRQQGEIDGAAAVGEPLAGGKGGNRGEAVAGEGIGQPDGAGRTGHAGDEGRFAVILTIDGNAFDGDGLAADGHGPGGALRCGRYGEAFRRGDADGDMVRTGGPPGVGDRTQLAGAGHFKAGGRVEYHPDGLAAAEDGGTNRGGPGEGQADLGGRGHGRDGDGLNRGGGRLDRGGFRGRGIEVQPDRTVGRAGAGVRALGEGQDQFGGAADGPGLDLVHAARRIDLQARDVGGGGRADANDDVAALAADLRPGADDACELDAGELGIGADADRYRVQRRADLLGQRGQGREQHRARRGGGHGGLENALSGGGPGHARAPSRERPFNAVNGW